MKRRMDGDVKVATGRSGAAVAAVAAGEKWLAFVA